MSYWEIVAVTVCLIVAALVVLAGFELIGFLIDAGGWFTVVGFVLIAAIVALCVFGFPALLVHK